MCGDDPYLARLASRLEKRTITYGTDSSSTLHASDIIFNGTGSSYRAHWGKEALGEIRIAVPGLHHVRNSLAALAVGLELEIPFSVIRQGLEEYRGVGRRFDILGHAAGITVVDDYAHHPAEIEATLAAARGSWPERRIVALFEPHRYTRTRDLMDRFASAFRRADCLVVTEIYPASERPIVGISGRRLAERIQRSWGGPVHHIARIADLPELVPPLLEEGDVVITMGAGSIGQIGRVLLERLEMKEARNAL